jgi:hypothetical protein
MWRENRALRARGFSPAPGRVLAALSRGRLFGTHVNDIGPGAVSSLVSQDSGLEEFSLNLTHGSFSALTFQSTEFAKDATQRFLSY